MITKTQRVKRLFWDIETSPNIMYSWRAGYKLDLGPHLIIKERKVITIAWKWEGESKVHALTWDDKQDDKKMLIEFAKVAHEADELIAHYGDGFDMPWFRTRCLIHGLTPLPAYKTIDTKAWAAKYFYFNSNKLDYLGSVLGHGHKLDTEWKLWEDVINKVPGKLEYMVKYNKQDVVLLEKVWSDLRFCVAPKTHAGAFGGLGAWTCPHCASMRVKKDKTRFTAQGRKQHQMNCTSCNSYYTVNEQTFNAYLQKDNPKAGPKVPAQKVPGAPRQAARA